MQLNPLIDGAPFVPLVRSRLVPPTAEQIAAATREVVNRNPVFSAEHARQTVEEAYRREDRAEIWASVQYTVMAHRAQPSRSEGFPPMDWLSIRRDDREPCRDWRHLQEIKNQLCGPGREGVEIYPAEERLVDTANQFHMWVLPAGEHWPFGFFDGRHVHDDVEPGMGARQRQR